MNEFMKLLLSLSLSGTLLFLLIFLPKQLYKNRFSQCWQYYIWLAVVLRFLFPFTMDTTVVGGLFSRETSLAAASTRIFGGCCEGQSPVSLLQGCWRTVPRDVMVEDNIVGNTAEEDSSVTTETSISRDKEDAVSDDSKDVCRYLFYIWFAAALVFLVQKITAYQSFIRYIRAGSTEVLDPEVLNLLAECEDKLGIGKTVELYRNPLIFSPVMIGLIRPAVILPAGQNNKGELSYIFTHELIHYKRCDLVYKWLMQVVICVHWFNPFVYLLEKEINRACELSCDEAVIHSLGDAAKKAYGDTLLSSVKTGSVYGSSLASVTLTEGAEQLKERLGAIMNFKRKSKMTTVIAMFIAIVICVCFVVIGAYGIPSGRESSLPDEEETYTMGYVNVDAVKVRKEASGSAEVNALFLNAQEVKILSEENGFYRISLLEDGETLEGYVRKEYIDIDALSD